MAKKATAKKVAVKGQLRPVVPIRISAEGKVLDPSVTVRVGQDVIWVAQNVGGPWTITFDNGSPFSESVYTVPRGGNVKTTGGAIKRGTYRYTVRDENGAITDEGEVVVE